MTPVFTPQDFENKGSWEVIPAGKVPMRIASIDKRKGDFDTMRDKNGRQYVRVHWETLDGKAMKPQNLGSLPYQVIRLMQATGLMQGNLVHPTCRENPEDPLSFDMDYTADALLDRVALLTITIKNDPNYGAQNDIKDFEQLIIDGVPAQQPDVIELGADIQLDDDEFMP